MVARDYRNRIIEQGSFVQYVGTKTRGVVDKISTKAVKHGFELILRVFFTVLIIWSC